MEIKQLTEETAIHIVPLFDAYRMFYEQESNVGAATDFINERLRNKESIIFAAMVDEQYVGFTQLYPTFSSVAMKRAFILNDLFVVERYRKTGVAQALYGKMGMLIENDVKHYIQYW